MPVVSLVSAGQARDAMTAHTKLRADRAWPQGNPEEKDEAKCPAARLRRLLEYLGERQACPAARESLVILHREHQAEQVGQARNEGYCEGAG